jgi:hypothetical protein
VKVGRGVRVTREAIEKLPEDIDTHGPKSPRLRGKPIAADDALFDLIGAGRSEGPTDVAKNKQAYLADAYEDRHDDK